MIPVAAAGIAILAAALRFYGLKWGLPNELHSYSYHPDEFLLIGAALLVFGGSLPGFYNYPSLYIYLSALALMVGTGYGATSTLAGVYLCARVVTVVMGIAAVAVTYWAGRILFNEKAGLAAALVLCLAPLHVQHSHFATVDVPSTLFAAAALGFAGLILKRGSWRDYILGGAMVGFAAGTKYNAAAVVLSIIAAHFARDGFANGFRHGAKIGVAIGCAAAAFIISTPAVILDTDQVWHGIGYELSHSAAGHGLVFAGTGSGFVYTLSTSLFYGLGPVLAAWSLAAVITALFVRDKRLMVILAFVLPYYVLISLSQVRFARYALPMYPALAILGGWFYSFLTSRVVAADSRRSRVGWGVLMSLLALLGLVYALPAAIEFGGPDPRDQAMQWISANIPKGSTIGMIDVPWFYSPPYSKDVGFGALPQRQEAAMHTPYNLVVFSEYEKQGDWLQEKPEYVVMSNYEVGDALRLMNNKSISKADRRLVDRILGDRQLVRRYYTPVHTFPGRRRTADFAKYSGVPHDMGYLSPKITIFERKKI